MNLIANLEALLFVAGKPVSPAELVKVLGIAEDELTALLTALEQKLQAEDSGLRLMRHADKLSLTTSPESTELIKKFLRAEAAGELTRPALETLTIIAYRGPVTKPEIEQIRGVNCSLILRNLLMRGLVEEQANEHQEPTYLVSHAFLAFLGLSNLEALPDYETLRHHPELEKALAELIDLQTPSSEVVAARSEPVSESVGTPVQNNLPIQP